MLTANTKGGNLKDQIVIGLCGKGGAGKSTFAKYIIQHSKIPFVQVNFKDALVKMAKMIGWNGEKDEKGRKLLQTLGTDVVRNCIDPDYWCRAWYDSIRFDWFIGGKSIIVDDVRFINEATMVKNIASEKSMKSDIIQLITNNQPEIMTEEAKNHISESGLPDHIIDMVIRMDYGLNHVETAAKGYLSDHHILKKGN